ncbi:hypothetical protein [Cupriavidus gilardii]|uniref:hypothetical protein n=1 Tax=Cupriavidus gilardii TaxID=82541 RepID=UPI0021B21708|nr:hypothetical protein [Cupriavidus gilardii]UXC34767.1 hypothetical protein N4G38_09970 [Cupriavidus gilardii]
MGDETLSRTVSKDEYLAFLSAADLSQETKSSEEEIQAIEDVLEIRRGILKGQDFYVGRSVCKCGHLLTFFDFVTTAVAENAHSKAFLVHALLGNKYGFQSPRTVKCSACGEIHPSSTYKTVNYSCKEGGGR